MEDKTSILQLLTPKAVLKPLTPEANASVPQGALEYNMIRIDRFPFSVGRESRVKEVEGKLLQIERIKFTGHEPNNSLYLIDAGRPLNISREHFKIEQNNEGYMLVDRYSACGTRVGSSCIGGGDRGGKIRLNDGDIIAVGTENTPYLFKFITL